MTTKITVLLAIVLAACVTSVHARARFSVGFGFGSPYPVAAYAYTPVVAQSVVEYRPVEPVVYRQSEQTYYVPAAAYYAPVAPIVVIGSRPYWDRGFWNSGVSVRWGGGVRGGVRFWR